MLSLRPSEDARLVQIVDAAVAEAARKSGDWLLCRPGCADCCVGIFPISQLDVLRLQDGLRDLQAHDPMRAARIRERAQASVTRLTPEFPGDSATGTLFADFDEAFAELGNDEVCPALDPETRTCDLYAYRPMTCRVFGPPLRTGDDGALGVCELCYHGASAEQIAACEVEPDPGDLEASLIAEAAAINGSRSETIVAYALLRS